MSTPTQIGAVIGLLFLLAVSLICGVVLFVAGFYYMNAFLGAALCFALAMSIAFTIYRESRP